MLIRLTSPDDPALWACIAAYSRFLEGAVPEEGPNPIPLPMPDATDFHGPRGACLLAEEGRPLGCVLLRPLDAGTAEVKRLYVMDEARGMGLARRLMTAAEDHARAMGYTALKLDTHRNLTPAIALYQALGWAEIAPYTGAPATHWFGKSL
ncbi:GNAT family N-acetyltransferase [Stagnihabitans tardus]|uniref:GNAT family N-acetyltransferase n=1 Tax=Stagnihabitans tardus TaxID=2699202 RepID=A0AAE4YBG9_9RHOB|nr:GNAT family N-acetyltransferase [Stagnihabitans tardus]NBZ87209.1 GNAT family N-acetyltransferase [Stagnihabitans tardus]